MNTIEVRTYVSDGPGRFFAYEPGDVLTAGPVLTVDVGDAPGTPEEKALDAAYYVGNRMGVDSRGQSWPANIRSLSVGDVLVIGETAYAVASFGFDIIDGEALARSLGPDAVVDPRSGRISVR